MLDVSCAGVSIDNTRSSWRGRGVNSFRVMKQQRWSPERKVHMLNHWRSNGYRNTLNRIPDEIVLSIETRPLLLYAGEFCICGWAVREGLARAKGVDATEINIVNFSRRSYFNNLVTLYGGNPKEWRHIYFGVVTRKGRFWFESPSKAIGRLWEERVAAAYRAIPVRLEEEVVTEGWGDAEVNSDELVGV